MDSQKFELLLEVESEATPKEDNEYVVLKVKMGPENNLTGFSTLEKAVKGLRDQIVNDHKDVKDREYGAQIYLLEKKFHHGKIQRGTTAKESRDGQAGVSLFFERCVCRDSKECQIGWRLSHASKSFSTRAFR